MTDYLGLLRLDGRVALVTGGGAASGGRPPGARAGRRTGRGRRHRSRRPPSGSRPRSGAARRTGWTSPTRPRSAPWSRRSPRATAGSTSWSTTPGSARACRPSSCRPSAGARCIAVNLTAASSARARPAGTCWRRARRRRQPRLDHGPGRRRPLPEPRLPQRQGRARQLHPGARLRVGAARRPGQRGRADLRADPADRAAARRPGDGGAAARATRRWAASSSPRRSRPRSCSWRAMPPA